MCADEVSFASWYTMSVSKCVQVSFAIKWVQCIGMCVQISWGLQVRLACISSYAHTAYTVGAMCPSAQHFAPWDLLCDPRQLVAIKTFPGNAINNLLFCYRSDKANTHHSPFDWRHHWEVHFGASEEETANTWSGSDRSAVAGGWAFGWQYTCRSAGCASLDKTSCLLMDRKIISCSVLQHRQPRSKRTMWCSVNARTTVLISPHEYCLVSLQFSCSTNVHQLGPVLDYGSACASANS